MVKMDSNSNGALKVLVINDDDDKREELSMMLNCGRGVKVIGQTRSGLQALSQAKQLVPHVVLMCSAPGTKNREFVETIYAIGEAELPSYLLILTRDMDEYLIPAIKAGVVGILSDTISQYELLTVIKQICLLYHESYCPSYNN